MEDSYGFMSQPFVSKYVHPGSFYGARSSPYLSPYSQEFPPQQAKSSKLYKHTIDFQTPGSVTMEVTNRGDQACLYIRKNRWFMSLSLSEIYDMALGMNTIIDKMEECKKVLWGQAIFQPRAMEDVKTVLRTSGKTKKLEKEEVKQFLYKQKQMLPDLQSLGGKKKVRKTPAYVEEEDVEGEGEEEEEEQEEGGEIQVRSTSSRSSTRQR